MAQVNSRSRFRSIFIRHFVGPIIGLMAAAWAVWAWYGNVSDPLEEIIMGLGLQVFLLTWGVVALIAKIIRDW